MSRTIWEVIGIISYPLAFALLESVLFLLGLVILAVILPGKFLRERFVAQGSLASLIATLGMIVVHFYGNDLGIWSARDFGKYLLLILGIILLSWAMTYYIKNLNEIIDSIARRLTPLSTVYLALNVMAIIVIVIRNI
jgi:hypothetical protein